VIGESDDDKRELAQYQFDKLPKIAKLKGPKFVFAHIISPHGPYVLNEKCENIMWTDIQTQKIELSYTNQVQCINKRLAQTIEAIQRNSDRPQVILLQSDEGAQFLAGRLTPPDNWKEANDLLLNQKFPILSALYLPGVSTDHLYETMTPVNSFRTIFNLYFSANLPLLPDKNYILPDMDHLYEFKDVTEKLAK
jgi:phosphoglycerol transferase MdoB-like AlkP superfamily enzyme